MIVSFVNVIAFQVDCSLWRLRERMSSLAAVLAGFSKFASGKILRKSY
jgi:hypothetical protein